MKSLLQVLGGILYGSLLAWLVFMFVVERDIHCGVAAGLMLLLLLVARS